MVIDYLLPKLGMSMNEGTINHWLVKEGEKIEKGQAILELETDKVATEIESPEAGYFHIIAEEGQTLKVNSLIAQICKTEADLTALSNPASEGDSGEDFSPTATNILADKKDLGGQIEQGADNTPHSSRVIASPLAKKIARDNKLSLAMLKGSGPQGRIIKQDVLAILEQTETAPTPLYPNSGAANDRDLEEKIRLPIKGMRKAIADNMLASLQNSAQLSSSWETDITDLLAVRKTFADREDKFGTRVSMNAFILKAIAYAAKQVPVANACLQGDELVIYNSVNIGIAVSVPGTTEYDSGLLVPVLKNVETLGLVGIDKAMKDLILRARNNQLNPDELKGSTITMTSTAGLAPPGCQATPIINRPNAVIINPSTPIEKPVVYQGEICVRTVMPLSLTFDHCLLDGEPAVRFANAIHECLEKPELMLA